MTEEEAIATAAAAGLAAVLVQLADAVPARWAQPALGVSDEPVELADVLRRFIAYWAPVDDALDAARDAQGYEDVRPIRFRWDRQARALLPDSEELWRVSAAEAATVRIALSTAWPIWARTAGRGTAELHALMRRIDTMDERPAL